MDFLSPATNPMTVASAFRQDNIPDGNTQTIADMSECWVGTLLCILCCNTKLWVIGKLEGFFEAATSSMCDVIENHSGVINRKTNTSLIP